MAVTNDTQKDLLTESRETIVSLRNYFSGNTSLTLGKFEKLLDQGQMQRDQLEAEIFLLRDKQESIS